MGRARASSGRAVPRSGRAGQAREHTLRLMSFFDIAIYATGPLPRFRARAGWPPPVGLSPREDHNRRPL
eukprot:2517733-Pyramimonas_sp.AAC.1